MARRGARAKQPRVTAPAYPTDGADYGPAVRFGRDVERVERPDPARAIGTIRGGKVRDAVHAMRVSGQITEAMWRAAERLRDDHALSQGVLDRELGMPRGSGHDHGGPTCSILDAVERVRLATQAMGRLPGEVVYAVVIGGATLGGQAQIAGIHYLRISERFRVGMESLVDFYGNSI